MNGTASPDLEVFQQMKTFDTSKPVILKAHRYLTDGKVKAVSIRPDGSLVHVYGTDIYSVQKVHSTWLCSCPSRQPVCAHVVAASLICDEVFEAVRAEKITPYHPGVFMGLTAPLVAEEKIPPYRPGIFTGLSARIAS